MRSTRHPPAHWRAGWGGWHGPWPEEWADRPLGPRMSERGKLLFPVLVSLLLQVPPSLFWVAVMGRSPATVGTLALAIAGPLVLLAARRFPGPTVLAMSILASLDFYFMPNVPSAPYVALAFAIVGALLHGARVWAWASVGAAWAVTLTFGLIYGQDWHPVRVALTTLSILLIFGIGEAVRGRREMMADFRKTVAQRRQSEVQAERVRIARELHDVLAHSLSQINVQAGVGLHLMERQPEKAAEALASIKETSKTALDEVRSVLGVLRSGTHDPDAPLLPEPDLSRLPGLAASVTAQGVEVTLDSTVREAPQAIALALYRIAQESLTNVVRHARASRATVSLRLEGGFYVLTIDDDGVGLDGRGSGDGRGMLGMRERAELLGGGLESGRSTLGGTRITARIPAKESE
ncbi:sensor histidine kinase [Salinibacterium soli]|uniref:histidine kinase n=1 Tax=Antiquaquibacter soli TaxID=3064523 RepID=A0ABT9BM96_9MICO|nr:sensor histidine kinase [Protaetiibacter sp. WY-16]MDO7882154.1 sensor histidine kinase [Protaetiibacter sp. WY-16]